MTQIKAVLMNVNLLGFLCLKFSYALGVVNIQENLDGLFRDRRDIEQVQL
jgi:hypothetical protein